MMGIIGVIFWTLMCVVAGFYAPIWWILGIMIFVVAGISAISNFIGTSKIIAVSENVSIEKNENDFVNIAFKGNGHKLKGTLLIENTFTHQTSRIKFQVRALKNGGVLKLKLCSAHLGNIKFSVENARNYDCFGITYKNMKLDIVGECLCVCNEISNKMRGFSQLAQAVKSNVNNGNTAIYDIKEYNIGDRLKDIHWKLSHRFGELYIKKYSTEGDENICLFFETSCKKNFSDFDSLAENFYAFGVNLLDENVTFYCGFYSNFDGKLLLKNVENISDFQSIFREILSVRTDNVTKTFSIFERQIFAVGVKTVIYFSVDKVEFGTNLRVIPMKAGGESD